MSPDVVVVPEPRRGFAYWGHCGRLQLPDGWPETVLEYLTEPPHGDPLYRLIVDRVVVGGSETPIPFFGRDLHLSACSRYLALTSLQGAQSGFHVVDLSSRGIWSAPGLVKIVEVSATRIRFRRYVYPAHDFAPTVHARRLLPKQWRPLAPGLALQAPPPKSSYRTDLGPSRK